MKGLILQFRRGRRTYTPRHFLIEVTGTDSREKAVKLVGKEVAWKSPGKESKVISGKIAAAHGNKGVIRAIFERGLPGQAIGTDVEILSTTIEHKPTKPVKIIKTKEVSTKSI